MHSKGVTVSTSSYTRESVGRASRPSFLFHALTGETPIALFGNGSLANLGNLQAWWKDRLGDAVTSEIQPYLFGGTLEHEQEHDFSTSESGLKELALAVWRALKT